MNNSQNNQNKDLEAKQKELEAREQAIRLKELERELSQREAPFYQTVPDTSPENKLKRWTRQAVKIGKFLGVVVIGIAAIQLGAWIAGVLLVGGIAWFSYKIFFESDDVDVK
jgi:hypothetical protein